MTIICLPLFCINAGGMIASWKQFPVSLSFKKGGASLFLFEETLTSDLDAIYDYCRLKLECFMV